MDIYINGISSISYQPGFENNALENFIVLNKHEEHTCIEPDYKTLIDPRMLRRMSRTIRMGISCAKKSLEMAGIEKPDAIVVGSGWGCIEDTEKFLNILKRNTEENLNPTPFIQSTHNTVAAQIALLLGCNGYNMTYTHNTLSFENALLDAILLLQEQPEKTVLLGGIDENTPLHETLMRKAGHFKVEIPGEGAAFFLLSTKKTDKAIAKISLADMGTGAEHDNAATYIPEKTDLLISNTHVPNMQYDSIDYTRYCGSYDTAIAFATWMAAQIVQKQQWPAGTNPPSHQPTHKVAVFNKDNHGLQSMIIIENA